MIDWIHKLKDGYAVLRYDSKEADIRKYNKSEYWNWRERVKWVANAKKYRTEDDAKEALVMSRILSKKSVWLG